MTSLTVNGSAAAASTLAAAGKLFNTTGGSSGNTSTKVGSSTGFKQVFAKGTTTNQTGAGSLPAPSDANFNGWMWDVTTLEGQQIISSTWTPTIHLLASTSTTVTPTVEWYKRSSGAVYTQIGTVAGSSIALTTSSQALTFTPPTLSAMNFATGDKLVMWLWVNQTAGGATNSTISVVEATSASSAGVVSEAQTVTPGYQATPALTATIAGAGAMTATLSPTSNYANVVLADAPLRYYRLDEPSGTVARDCGSQAQNGTISASGVTKGVTGLIVSDGDPAMTFISASSGNISLPTTSLPTGTSAWSIECWTRCASLPGALNYVEFVCFGTRVAGGEATIYYNGDVTKFELGFDGGNIADMPALATAQANTTYHLVATYDGTKATFYINGVQQAQTTGAINITAGGAFIAQDPAGGFHPDGTVDEVAFYGSALSSARVMTHYLAGTSTVTMAGASTLTMSAPTLSTALAATISGTGTLAPTLTASLALPSVTLSGSGTLTGTMAATAPLTNTIAGVGTLAVSSPSLSTSLAATIVSIGTLAPAITASFSLASVTISGIGTLGATMAATTAISAECDAVGTLTASLTAAMDATVPLVATLPGTGSLSGALVASLSLTTTTTGAGTITGTMTRTAPLLSTLVGIGVLSASSPTLATALNLECAGQSMLLATVTYIIYAWEYVTTWQARDLSAEWQARDLTSSWQTRDGLDTWETRDLTEAWQARDLETTWKE